jgi:hypothetical protein
MMPGEGGWRLTETFVLLCGWIVALLVHRILRVLAGGEVVDVTTAGAGPVQEHPLREVFELLAALAFALAGFRFGAWIGPRFGLAELSIALLFLPFAVWWNLRRPAAASFLLPARQTGRRAVEAVLTGASVAMLPLLLGRGVPEILFLLLPDSTADVIRILVSLGADLVLAGLTWRLSQAAGPALASGVAALALTWGTPAPASWIGTGALLVLFWLIWRAVLRSRDVIWLLAAHAVMHGVWFPIVSRS